MSKLLLQPQLARFALLVLCSWSVGILSAQDIKNNPTSNHGNKFEALGTILPDPKRISHRQRSARTQILATALRL